MSESDFLMWFDVTSYRGSKINIMEGGQSVIKR